MTHCLALLTINVSKRAIIVLLCDSIDLWFYWKILINKRLFDLTINTILLTNSVLSSIWCLSKHPFTWPALRIWSIGQNSGYQCYQCFVTNTKIKVCVGFWGKKVKQIINEWSKRLAIIREWIQWCSVAVTQTERQKSN